MKRAWAIGLFAWALAACGAPDPSNTDAGTDEISASGESGESVDTASADDTDGESAPDTGTFKSFGETCFGIDAPAALKLLGVEGGKADVVRSGTTAECRLLDPAGKAVATIVAGPLADFNAQSTADAQLLQTVTAQSVTILFANAENMIPVTLQGNVNLSVPLFVNGFGLSPHPSRLGWFGANDSYILATFDGPTFDQAKQMVADTMILNGPHAPR